MKLVTLNTWGARIRVPFLDFIKKNQDVDIFCFQEIYDKAEEKLSAHYPQVSHNIFTELQELLPTHQSFFRPVLEGVYGIAIFVKKEIPILEEGEIVIHRGLNYPGIHGHHSRNLQWVKCQLNKRSFTVVNVHGLWNGKGKTDTPERIAQSKSIRAFMDTIDGSKILCGDFNLEPHTESLNILETGMKNLVKEHSVTSTRTSFYEKPGKFADYIFLTPDIQVKDFQVLPDEVSDHAALFLEI